METNCFQKMLGVIFISPCKWGEFQTEVSTPMPYSLRREVPFEVSSLKGVGHYCLL